MRLKRYLADEYIGNFEHFGNYIEIFKNPTRKEMLDAGSTKSLSHDPSGKNVRFIIDMKNKDIYVWNPNSYHVDAAVAITKEIGGDAETFMSGTGVPGVATFQGGKWVMTAADEMDSASYWVAFWSNFKNKEIAKNVMNRDLSDFDWVKAIDVEPFFNRMLVQYWDGVEQGVID